MTTVEVGERSYSVGPGALIERVPLLDGPLVYVEELSGKIRLLTDTGELFVTPELARLARAAYFSGNE